MHSIIQKIIILTIVCILAIQLHGQDSTLTSRPKITFSAYVEGYFSYDFSKPPDHNRPWFLYNFNRANKPAVNLLWAKLTLNQSRFRANLALATGTYIKVNYASEPDWAKPLFEVNVGLKLSKKNDLWLDAGILPSHI